MQCPNCNTQLDDDTIFCGNCGKQVVPLHAQGATVSYKGGPDESEFATIESDFGSQRPAQPIPAIKAQYGVPTPVTPPQPGTLPSPPPPKPPSQRANAGRIALIAALVLLVVAGGTIGLVALLKNNNPGQVSNPGNAPLASNATGVVVFSDTPDSSGHSNVVTISVNNLPAPPAGSQYNAWLVNTLSEHAVALGTLKAKDGSFTLNFADGGTNLLGTGDKVEVTLEKGAVDLPTGQVLLSVSFPPKAFVHIRHLLVHFFDTPGNIGLLVGAVDQAQKLSAVSQLLQSIAPSQNAFAIQCAAQSIVDIAEGAHGPHYQALASGCASQNITKIGDGYGLLGSNGYIANGEAHASLAATQSDSTDSIRVHARHVGICLENMRGWITTVDQDALALLNNPTNTSKIQEIVALSNHALNGVDTNGDESIDPVKGEGGAATAYYHGQLMAGLVLAPSRG